MKNEMNLVLGFHAVEALLKVNPTHVKAIHYEKSKRNARLEKIISLAEGQKIPLFPLDKKTFDQQFTTEGNNHQGVVAEIASSMAWVEQDLTLLVEQAQAPLLLLILDGITDPHNLGACLRSADAFGVDAVIAPKDKNVGLTATVKKVACGAAETIPFIPVTNLARTMRALQAQGVWVYGAAGEATSSLYESDFKSHVAIAMGAEGKGLRRLTRDHCDHLFAIPMVGTVESLNVSVAAGICLSEVQRQRNHY